MKKTFRAKGQQSAASISLKNLPPGTTEEGLLQGLNGVNVNPTGTTIVATAQPQDLSSDIWFADYETCNQNANIIEKAKNEIKINGQSFGSVQIAGITCVETPGADLFPSELSDQVQPTPGATPQGTPQAPQAKQQAPPKNQETPTPGAMTRYNDGKALTPGEPGYDQASATPDA